MRVPAFEAVDDEEVAAFVGECFDEQLIGLGEDRALALDFEPFADVGGEALPVVGTREEFADPLGEVGRHRHALPAVGDEPRRFGRGVDDDVAVLEPFDLEAQSGEENMIADRERRSKPFLDLAEHSAVLEAHIHHRIVDDDSGVEAVLDRDCGGGDSPAAGAVGGQAAVFVIGFERVAAGGDVGEDSGEDFVGEAGVGGGGIDFGEEFGLAERAGAGDRENVLGEGVEGARAEDVGVELMVVDRVQCGAGLEIFEAVAGNDYAFGGLVEAVIGAADPLEQARRTLGSAHLDDEVNIAPVDPEVEAGGGDERAQPAVAHRGLDLAAGFERKAAVVDADG